MKKYYTGIDKRHSDILPQWLYCIDEDTKEYLMISINNKSYAGNWTNIGQDGFDSWKQMEYMEEISEEEFLLIGL